jgi:hypothetical protein
MTQLTHQDDRLEEHLRTTLRAVAATVEVTPVRGRSVRRTVKVAAGAVALTLGAAAFVAVRTGPEYVDRLPVENALVSGEATGTRYWLVPSFHRDACGRPMPGVEIVVESLNQRGQEWNTGGFSLGESTHASDDCAPRPDPVLPPPGDAVVGVSMRLGEDDSKTADWAFTAAVHPTVTSVRLTVDGVARDLPTVPRPDDPDGARYTMTPVGVKTQTYSVTLLRADGSVVPCSDPARCGPRDLPRRG